jgi:hypothetical protein
MRKVKPESPCRPAFPADSRMSRGVSNQCLKPAPRPVRPNKACEGLSQKVTAAARVNVRQSFNSPCDDLSSIDGRVAPTSPTTGICTEVRRPSLAGSMSIWAVKLRLLVDQREDLVAERDLHHCPLAVASARARSRLATAGKAAAPQRI